ncbi:hypothetical protein B0H13DRAFT_1895967 [Mycena leptocephala]|nr:hypothetical protein B0H13DRAFT_1895967 [Mycena leptocephala]
MTETNRARARERDPETGKDIAVPEMRGIDDQMESSVAAVSEVWPWFFLLRVALHDRKSDQSQWKEATNVIRRPRRKREGRFPNYNGEGRLNDHGNLMASLKFKLRLSHANLLLDTTTPVFGL